jgi:glycosyltransferase involved in cell wall biosynthesis
LRELVPTLIETGIDVSIAYMVQRPTDNEEELREAGARLNLITGPRFDSRIHDLRRVIANQRPDIVHTTLFDADIPGRLAAWRAPECSPVVLSSIVNMSYDPARLADPNVRPWKLQAARLLDGWTARHLTDHFHAVSWAVKSAAVASLGINPDRVTVIERGRDPVRLGVPSAERRARARATLGLGEEVRAIVTVGRQEFQKAQDDLVSAFELLAANHNDVELFLVGPSGNRSRELRVRVDGSGHRDRIHMLGHRDDVPDILAAADLFVFPSLYEGFPGAVIEAMALGLPVIASQLPTLQELVEDGCSGLLVPPGNPARLAEAIRRVVGDPRTSRRLGERGRELFLARLTTRESHRRTVQLYERLLAAGGASKPDG